MRNKIQKIIDRLPDVFQTAVTAEADICGDDGLTVSVNCLHDILEQLHVNGYEMLHDICSIDHGVDSDNRFELIYHVFSFKENHMLRLRVSLKGRELEAPTATDIWPAADWHEREVYDMMGIVFTDHPNLRRILMWDDYPYHPLRKDFPLGGIETDQGETAFAKKAPLAGGPFVTTSTGTDTNSHEPRART